MGNFLADLQLHCSASTLLSGLFRREVFCLFIIDFTFGMQLLLNFMLFLLKILCYLLLGGKCLLRRVKSYFQMLVLTSSLKGG